MHPRRRRPAQRTARQHRTRERGRPHPAPAASDLPNPHAGQAPRERQQHALPPAQAYPGHGPGRSPPSRRHDRRTRQPGSQRRDPPGRTPGSYRSPVAKITPPRRSRPGPSHNRRQPRPAGTPSTHHNPSPTTKFATEPNSTLNRSQDRPVSNTGTIQHTSNFAARARRPGAHSWSTAPPKVRQSRVTKRSFTAPASWRHAPDGTVSRRGPLARRRRRVFATRRDCGAGPCGTAARPQSRRPRKCRRSR